MISLFELLKIGVGPSSSHTVGPMIAALRFVQELSQLDRVAAVDSIAVDLYGSLALTGIGHRTDRAVIAGLSGQHPRTVDPANVDTIYDLVETSQRLSWGGEHKIEFRIDRDLRFHRDEFLPQHPNGLLFTATSGEGVSLLSKKYFSVGGGFVVDENQLAEASSNADATAVKYPFTSADQLLGLCSADNLSIAQVVQANELSFHPAERIDKQLDEIWSVMWSCIEAGCQHEGILPGGLGVKRRAPDIHRRLLRDANLDDRGCLIDPMKRLDWVTLYALAVNEENAAGGRVVTAPTNGAAGVIPAVLAFWGQFMAGNDPGVRQAGIREFLMTSAAIGMLYKRNASLSAAEMGCQGEVGVACSMAAGGLAAVMGGTPAQVENAAEIGMEHNLGLTCDPVAGLVQVPCIERNAMGAVKAINAARMAVLYGDGQHRVSLDKVIETMRQTGVDMQSKYKETSLGGLALNVVNC